MGVVGAGVASPTEPGVKVVPVHGQRVLDYSTAALACDRHIVCPPRGVVDGGMGFQMGSKWDGWDGMGLGWDAPVALAGFGGPRQVAARPALHVSLHLAHCVPSPGCGRWWDGVPDGFRWDGMGLGWNGFGLSRQQSPRPRGRGRGLSCDKAHAPTGVPWWRTVNAWCTVRAGLCERCAGS